MTQNTVLGTSIVRLDAAAKCSGKARYTEDLHISGMRHAAYVRAPLAHAYVKSIDATAALALAGVDAIFTHEDVPTSLFAPAGHPHNLEASQHDVADCRILTQHVRFFGDAVALIVARDVFTAQRAACLVAVEYEALPVMTTLDAALAATALPLHPQLTKTNLIKEHSFTFGDVNAAFAKAPTCIEGTWQTSMAQHCHLENQTAYAYMEDTDRITIVSSTQIPHICRRVVGQALSIPWSHIRVIKPYIGGGFGNKQDVILEPAVAFLTKALGGLPVSLSLTREECLLATRVRHPFSIKSRLAIGADATLLAIDLDVLSNTGAYASHGHAIATAGGAKASYIYPRAAYTYRARTVYTNSPIGGAFRGYGSPQITYAIECAVDDAAKHLRIDPLAFRLKNIGRVGDTAVRGNEVLTSYGLFDVLTLGYKRFNWDARKKAAKRTGSLRTGVGLAVSSYGTGTYPHNVEHAGARLSLHQDGTITLITGAAEIGQGADTVFAQMVAETTGFALNRVHVVSTQDTEICPWDPGAFASRQTHTTSHAIYNAATLFKQKVLAYAGAMTGHDPSILRINGHAIIDFASQTPLIPLEELALDSFYNKERGGQIFAEDSTIIRTSPVSYGCTFIELEVDIPLCKVRIIDMLNVHDAGTIINPILAKGQVQGGMAMGIGWALSEEILMDAATGRVHNNNLLDYKVPTASDIPDLDVAFIDSPAPLNEIGNTPENTSGSGEAGEAHTINAVGPYGAKSLGEPPLVSPAPAIRNAILDATGIALNSLPMSPQSLFMAFREAGLLTTSKQKG